MILISKEEAEFIRAYSKTVHIMKTMRKCSGRGKYYVEETKAVLKLLSKYRNEGILINIVGGV